MKSHRSLKKEETAKFILFGKNKVELVVNYHLHSSQPSKKPEETTDIHLPRGLGKSVIFCLQFCLFWLFILFLPVLQFYCQHLVIGYVSYTEYYKKSSRKQISGDNTKTGASCFPICYHKKTLFALLNAHFH